MDTSGFTFVRHNIRIAIRKVRCFPLRLNGWSNINVNDDILLLVNYLTQDKFDDNTRYTQKP